MIEEQVIVTSITAKGAWVEGIKQSACGSCSAKVGCGQHTMSQLGRKVSLWLAFEATAHNQWQRNLQLGQQIVVGLPEGAILKSTLVLYGVPLFTLVLGAVLGNFFRGEAGAIITSMLFMLLGFKLARYWSEQNKQHWQPHFIRHCALDLITTSK